MLRGINLGPSRRVPMAELRALFKVSRPVLEIACKNHRCIAALTD